jgi:hypothetical protein
MLLLPIFAMKKNEVCDVQRKWRREVRSETDDETTHAFIVVRGTATNFEKFRNPT